MSTSGTLLRLSLADPSGSSGHGAIGRREVKFPFPHADVAALERVLESNCLPISYHQSVSTVRSIYFDDVALSACRANLDGVGRRTKLRLRWYDTVWPKESFFLEVKWRNNRVTGKARSRLTSSVCLSSVPFRELFSGMLDLVPEGFHGELLQRREPIVLVEYKRRHFVSRDHAIRITLDYDLVFYDQCGKVSMCSDWPVRGEPLVVVEGKVPTDHDPNLASLLFPVSPRAGRSSKYVLACRTLGLVRAREY